MQLQCQHCDYKWDYLGDNEYYATCPRCRYKVRIPEDKASVLRRMKLDRELKRRFPTEKKPVKLLGIAGIVKKVMDDYLYDESMLIQILLTLQRNFGWLPREMLMEVSKQLGIPLYQVYQVATFYKAFSPSPRGKHVIRVCMGTSCKIRDAPIILDRLQKLLGVERGETTQDGRFSLETVKCIGCCGPSPTMTVDSEHYGSLKPEVLEKILARYT
jgi:NADH-quinone oxidoreductase subunit E